MDAHRDIVLKPAQNTPFKRPVKIRLMGDGFMVFWVTGPDGKWVEVEGGLEVGRALAKAESK
jgi:hypothetical protein